MNRISGSVAERLREVGLYIEAPSPVGATCEGSSLDLRGPFCESFTDKIVLEVLEIFFGRVI